jgi:chitinase
LTLTVPADTAILLNGYNLEVIHPLVDYVIIMGQDFQGFWSSTTGHHSPLHGETRSLEKTLNYFTESKFPSEKIILGIPFVGRTFLLRTEEMDKPGHSLGSASQGGFRGTFQFDDDILAYNEVHSLRFVLTSTFYLFIKVLTLPMNTRFQICFDIYHLKKNWSVYLDLEAKVPFMRDGNKWVSFDDPQSVTQKVELGIQKHLGGFAAWSIDTDDFKGSLCTPEGTKEITYPLLRSINYVLSIKTNSSNARPLEEKTESTDNSSVSRISSSLYIFSFFVINIFVFL